MILAAAQKTQGVWNQNLNTVIYEKCCSCLSISIFIGLQQQFQDVLCDNSLKNTILAQLGCHEYVECIEYRYNLEKKEVVYFAYFV